MRDNILLVTHVPVRQSLEGFLIDDQTAKGIAQWCKHFDKVTYVGIEASGAASTSAWTSVSRQPGLQNCDIFCLPQAYRLRQMLGTYRAVRVQLRRHIAEHKHLCFTIGGLVGDWPAVAALEARALRRDYVAWIDRVEPQIIRHAMASASLKRRLKNAIELPLMERYQRFILAKSEVALLQGMDTYNYFSASAPNPHCIYDTHTTQADRIEHAALAAKLARVEAGGPLELVYAGRAAPMKGTDDWLDVLTHLDQQDVPFRARWIGDGPDLAAMRARVENSSLRGKVLLAGFEGEREVLLRALRDSDMLLFCHKTPESPRCLIEALVSGCPIVGYGSAYATGLAAQEGGAALVEPNQVRALAEAVQALHRDRTRLASLIRQAALSGRLYDEDTVYAHRARLMGAA